MNLIKELIKAKGLTERRVAAEIGVGYHSLNKMVTRARFVNKRGEVKFRECRHIREKFASWLGYPYEMVWGPNADIFLKKLIAEEIERWAIYQTRKLKSKRLQALGIL